MINKISSETINAILRKTAYRLPDNPSEQGFKAADIKKAFYQFIDDATASLVSEMNRIVEEANDDIYSKDTSVDSHTGNKNNPHEVTKTQVGLGNVDNTSDMDKPVSTAQQTAISAVQSNLTTHEQNTENPHAVTKSQVGLDKVDNTSDEDKPISKLQQAALNEKINTKDIVDDLISTDADKPVSAKQAKILNEKIPTAYGATLSVAYVAATGVLTIILKDQNSNVLSSAEADLPLELLLASSGSYYKNGVIYLKLANGSFISVDVSDLVATYTADGQTISMSEDGVISISDTFKAKINDAYAAKHSHSNKDLLDTYTQTNENITSAITNKHSHSNKTVLDNTTASFTTAKNTALENVTKTTASVTISVADWAGGTSCTKSVGIVKGSNTIMYSPDESSYTETSQSEVRVSAQASGQLTFTCSTTPDSDITINIVALG